MLNDIKKEILEYELESINKFPELKEYFKNTIKNNKNINSIKLYYDNLQNNIKKYKNFYKIIDDKKKFYVINNLNIIFLDIL